VLQAQGNVFRAEEEYEKAQSLYENSLALYQAIGAQQGDANSYLEMARLARARGDAGQAQQYAQQAIERHTATGDRYSLALDYETLASACQAAGDSEAAIAAQEQAVAAYQEIGLADQAARALSNLGGILDKAERGADALNVYAQAVEMQPNQAWLRRNYANSLLRLGRLDEAASQLDIAEAQEPDAPYLALRRAELAKARGDRSQAQTWAAEALRRQPAWDEAQAILAWAAEMKN